MAKRLIPLLDRVLVEKLKPVNKSIGGVLLPDTATHKVRLFGMESAPIVIHSSSRLIPTCMCDINILRSSGFGVVGTLHILSGEQREWKV